METLRKEERLCNKKVIDHLFVKGECFFSYPFKVCWLEDEMDSPYPARILISVSKNNFNKAIQRNKIKRLIKEAYRKNKQLFYDHLNRVDRRCAFALIYTAKDVLPYHTIVKEIILILQRLQKEYEKVVE